MLTDAHPIGVVLTQLGTPDAPTPSALRRYLREFLGDPRVVDLPRWIWWPILFGPILTLRPRRSAKLYRKVWTDEGSPLLVITRRQEAGVRERLTARYSTRVRLELGMRYGNPSLDAAVSKLRAEGCRRLLLVPLYPQHSVATTASSSDAFVAAALTGYGVPALRIAPPFPEDPGYIESVATRVRAALAEGGAGVDRVLFSFHGQPVRYVHRGDPYADQCAATTAALVSSLGLAPGSFEQVWQSRFGPDRWLEPSLLDAVDRAGKQGLRSLLVACPGFVADCLETIEEVGQEIRNRFLSAGGREFRLVPCVNDDAAFLDALTSLITRELSGWI